MVRIAVCDDQPDDLAGIECQIRHALSDMHMEAEVHAFSSGEDVLAAHRSAPFHIAFLDVYMQPLSGLDVARGVRAQGDDCEIVFITVSREHAVEGFAVRARHYLVKPVGTQDVAESLDRCVEGLREALRTITVKNGKLDIPVLLHDIESVEVFDKVSVLYTRRGEVRTYAPLDRIEEALGGGSFLRCHRCAIVNMRWVKAYTATDFEMCSGRRVPIRKSERVAMRQRYLDYLFAQTRAR